MKKMRPPKPGIPEVYLTGGGAAGWRTPDESPYLVLKIYPTGGHVKLATSFLSQEATIEALERVAQNIRDFPGEWSTEERDLRDV